MTLFKKAMMTVVTVLMTVTPLISQNKVPIEKKMGAYLFVYFSDDTHSLYMATSHDGYTFTDVNGGMPIMDGDTLADQHGIRDPHIYRSPKNGRFYMALTDLHVYGQKAGLRATKWERSDKYGWGNNRGIVMMSSDDLIHWTHKEVYPAELFPERFGDLACIWAPQTIYDPETDKLMVYFTIRQQPGGKTRLFYSYADDDFTTLLTEPKLLFQYPNEKSQVLDADICPMPDGGYFLTYVSQERNNGGIKRMFSNHINRDYQYVEGNIDTENGGCEAPMTWKRIGQDKWVTMYDICSIRPFNFGFVETSDFQTFTPLGRFNEGVMKTTNFEQPKHGAIIQITKKEAKRLEKFYRKK